MVYFAGGGPKVDRYRFIKAQAETYPVQSLCDVLDVSRSCYYEWLQGTPCKRVQATNKFREAAYTINEASRGTYGRRRIAAHLAKQGQAVSPARVERRMKELGIQGLSPRAFVTTTRDSTNLEISPNLIKGEAFEVTSIDQV